MGRKCIAIVLVALFLLPTVAFAGSGELTMMDKASFIERILYGSEQTGPLVDRVGRIESDMYGAETKTALVTRLDKVYMYMTDNSVAPSFLLKLNGVEWTLAHTITSQPAKERIENLEKIMVGTAPPGSLDDRLNKLTTLAYPNNKVEAVSVTIPKDTLLKITLSSALGSKISRKGDVIHYTVAEDVFASGALVIAKGAVGTGKVLKVTQAESFGRDAQLESEFDNVTALDTSMIDTVLGEKAKKETASMLTAAGASVAGMLLLGPIGIVGGVFIHGQDVTIPAGTELFIQTKDDLTVYGIKVK